MRKFQSLLFPDPTQAVQLDDPLSVSDVNALVKALIEDSPDLTNVRVAGEISNLSRPASGHIYFTLKDATAQLRCVMWRSSVARMRSVLRDGEAVVARGKVSVYERDGQYQLVVEAMVPRGMGDLYAEFERLKLKLQVEGLFDPLRKRLLPVLPQKLGVVTSASAAAFQDILNVLRRRYPLIEVTLSPTLVQGENAPPMIVQAIQNLNDMTDCDVILVARGGGSIEELWAFNDERVVRAIAASRLPVVTGVGHEIDFTLADFAADVRAPTPSAAAEMITPDVNELRMNVDAYAQYLDQSILRRVNEARTRLMGLKRTLLNIGPINQMQRAKTQIIELQRRLEQALMAYLSLQRVRLTGLTQHLEAIGPAATLARGYAIVQRQRDGHIVRLVTDALVGDALRVRLSDGEFEAKRQ
ncbi:MAG: exodeoxyribonuclease VII large subunit [Chloroflexota bacterium]|jgi:exodeoxyribonuclease VII large subunit|nr:exodeoxyribonuclease VII large subunit [Chloroflexota bacterium]